MAEGTSDMVEVPSDQDSDSDPDVNFQSTSMEQTTSESFQSDSPSVISLLDRLRSPTNFCGFGPNETTEAKSSP